MADEVTTIEGLIRLLINNALIDVHTSMPATIQAVNADGTINAAPSIKRIKQDKTEYELPVLPNVPVLYPNSTGYSVTFPVTKGDEGLLVFSERDISRFISTGEAAAPLVHRKHDITDAVFIPAMLSDPNRPAVTPADGLELKDKAGGASIQLQGGNVNITGVLTINGIPYLTHVHTGGTLGGGLTGVVNTP